MAIAADLLAIALAQLATISERRSDRLVDPSLSGLPAFLTRDSGLHSGYMLAQVTAAALASEIKTLAHPASVDTIPTSANREDHVSMSMGAALKAERARRARARDVVAVEILCACQAIDLLAPLTTSPALAARARARAIERAAARRRSSAVAGHRSDCRVIAEGSLERRVRRWKSSKKFFNFKLTTRSYVFRFAILRARVARANCEDRIVIHDEHRQPTCQRSAGRRVVLQRMAAGSRAADADEQPRSGGCRTPRRSRRLRRLGPRRAQLDGVRCDRRDAAALEHDETLVVQSGKPVAVFRTHPWAPRVLIANALLVPAWANWDTFRDLEDRGLTMYGQMTAGSWIYIGTQGILQGTYETLAEIARRHFGGTLSGRVVVTAGLGGMGGAQPLAVTMNDGIALVVDVDPSRIERRLATRYVDERAANLDDALARIDRYRREQIARSIALEGNAALVLPELVAPPIHSGRRHRSDVCARRVERLRARGRVARRSGVAATVPARHLYARDRCASMADHVRAMLAFKRAGAVVFDYGNNIRAQADKGGVAEAFEIPGFVPEYIRPLFCEGRGPFRWAALSGQAADIAATDALALEMFADNPSLVRWIRQAQERVAFQGLPARILWLGYGERARFGLAINDLVRRGAVAAPIVIGRDHLDAGSVASPYRETEQMRDGSDAIADWPILNALLNTSAGATWVSVHHGGGVGIGYSIHAGMVVVADGSREADEKLQRVLTCDPGLGVVRHADAGYGEAIDTIRRTGITMPSLSGHGGSGR